MSEHDDPTEERELYEEVPPRSIFAATWFRVLLVVIVIGVIGAVAIPYVLDFMNPPPTRPATAPKPPTPAVAVPATPPPGPLVADKPAEKPETTSTPAPPPASATATPAETRPTPSTARPAEPKPAAPKTDSKTTAAASEKGKTAMAVTEATPPKSPTPAPKSAPATKPDTAAKSDTPATEPVTKDVAKAATAKPATATKPAPTPKRAAVAATAQTATASTSTGPFWVQVGAFKDADTAKKVATKLREENFKVEESVTRSGGAPPKPAPAPAPSPAPAAKPELASDQYDVFVSGQTAEELNKRLAAKGLAAEASSGGMVVKPSLPLRDAVALSKDLAVEGFKVQVRRAGGSMGSAAAPAAPAPSAPATTHGGAELHRVRVGSFPDRAAAQEAVRQLEAKGYKPYIARGDQ